MLSRLKIKNLALIEDMNLTFGSGFNVLTGETGAGKSIIVSGLQLIVGAKASEELIRTGFETAEIEAAFQLDPKALKTLGLEDEGSELLVYRRLVRGKAGVCQINGKVVPLKQIKAMISPLLQITGQFDTQVLFETDEHLRLLDAYGFNRYGRLLSTYQTAFQTYQKKKKNLDALNQDQSDRDQKVEFLSFQIQDIESQSFQLNEDEELDSQRGQVKHAVAIQEGLTALEGRLENIQTTLAACQQDLRPLLQVDDYYQSLSNELEEQHILVDEKHRDISARLVEVDRSEDLSIDEIETRLDTIFKYKNKYKVDSIQTLLALYDRLVENRDQLSNYEASKEELEKEVQQLFEQAKASAETLHLQRIEMAKALEYHVQTQMKDLNFTQNKFIVSVTETEILDRMGQDEVEFLVSTNPGEPPKPIQSIASGGELSRLMLCLKTIPGSLSTSSIVFDEIDTGIGGLTANAIGEKLSQLATSSQVICITHLPQIAQFASSHFVVEKHLNHERTIVTIKQVLDTQKDAELQRMMGGETLKRR